MNNRGIEWNDNQISQLKELYEKGETLDDISKVINRSHSAIAHKLKDLGLTGNRRVLWTDEDIKQLKDLFDKGVPYPEIGKIMNKSPRGCQAKAVRFGWIRKECNVWLSNSRSDFWIDSEIETLKKCIADGLFMDDIKKQINRSVKCIYNKMHELDLHFRERTDIEKSEYRRAYSVDDDYFDKIDTQKKAYWLGWMVTDGYVITKLNTKRGVTNNNSIGLKLSEIDRNVLEDFKKDLKTDFDIQFVKRRDGFLYKNKITGKECVISGGNQAELRFSSAKMIQDLAKYGVVQNKTYDIGFPKELNSEFYPGFIAGVISGDGCIDIHKIHKVTTVLRCTIAGNLDLVQNIHSILVKEIGVNPDKKLFRYKHTAQLYRLELNQTETINLYNWFKENGVKLMERKNKIIEDYLAEKEIKAA